jgi:hypothetical protein
MIKPDIILCDILSIDMGLDAERVVVYNQNFKAPKDDDIYIVVSQGPMRPIGNNNRFDFENDKEIKKVSIFTTYNIEITSKNTDAKYRAPEVLAAIGSTYSEQKQELNHIRIFRTAQILDLSFIEGRSALHRYQIPVIINSVQIYEKSISIYDKFQEPSVLVEAP